MGWHRVSLAQKNFKSYKIVLHVWPQADYRTPTTELLSKLGWSKLKERRNKQKAVMMFKIINGQNGITPVYLEEMFSTNIGRSVYNVRTSRWNLALPAAKRDSWLPEKLCLHWGKSLECITWDEIKCERYTVAAFKDRLDSLNLSIEV